jgi:transketolase
MAPERSTDLRQLRQQMMRIAVDAGEGHLPSSYSVLEILWTLHAMVMRPGDKFVLSKGHAALALYAVLVATRRAPAAMLDSFCVEWDGPLGHPERAAHLGIESTTGSLGHGCAMSAGIAYGLKIGGQLGTVYCLLGDQELNEGSCYEAMLLAHRFKLDNLVWIIDDNHSADRSTPVESIGHKFLAFGWGAEPCSGHSIESIERALLRPRLNKPHVIIANTVKGFGLEEFEADPQAWHHKCPPPERLHEMLEAVR